MSNRIFLLQGAACFLINKFKTVSWLTVLIILSPTLCLFTHLFTILQLMCLYEGTPFYYLHIVPLVSRVKHNTLYAVLFISVNQVRSPHRTIHTSHLLIISSQESKHSLGWNASLGTILLLEARLLKSGFPVHLSAVLPVFPGQGLHYLFG